jgi:hypothetical protein
MCDRCGTTAEGTRRRGMCDRCYSRWHRCERPVAPCSHCGQDRGSRPDGLCNACYLYRWRTGKPRPLSFPKVCRVCGERPARAHRRKCGRCDHLGQPGQRCANPECRKPLEFVRSTNGYCHTCYMYYWRYGRRRPASLARPGGHPWCDCGRPATRVKKVLFLRHGQRGRNYVTQKLELCDACWELERELVNG